MTIKKAEEELRIAICNNVDYDNQKEVERTIKQLKSEVARVSKR